MTPDPLKSLLTIQEAAKFLKVSTKTLRRWEDRGILAPVRTSGGHRRYNLVNLRKLKGKKYFTSPITSSPIIKAPDENLQVSQTPIEPEKKILVQQPTPISSIPSKETLTPFRPVHPQFVHNSEAIPNSNRQPVQPRSLPRLDFSSYMNFFERPQVEKINKRQPHTNTQSPWEIYEKIVTPVSSPSFRQTQKENFQLFPQFVLQKISVVIAVFFFFFTIITATAFTMQGLTESLIAENTGLQALANWYANHFESKTSSPSTISLASTRSQILGENIGLEYVRFNVNTQSRFAELAEFSKDIFVNQAATVSGTLAVNSGNIITTAESATIFTSVTDLSLAATTGTTSINNSLNVGGNLIVTGLTNDIAGTLNLSGNTLTSTGDLTIDPGGGGVSIGTASPGNIDLTDSDLFVSGDLEIDGIIYAPTANISGTATIGTVSVNADDINDFTGTGLIVSGGALQTTLGTSISSSEIDDDSILESDLQVSNTPTAGQVLSYNATTGAFTWVDDQSGDVSLWTDGGSITYLTSTTDDLAIGGSTSAAPFYFETSTGNLTISGSLAAATDETINGIDINSGTVSDVVNLTINAGGDITIGTIGLNDTGTSNTDSGASLVGVFDEFSNSSGTNIQDVLDDFDAAIGGGASKFTQDTGFIYLTNSTDSVTIGGSTELAKLGIDGDSDQVQLLVQGNGTQTNSLFRVETSGSTSLFTVDNSGNVVLAGSITVNSETISDFTGDGLAINAGALGINLPTATDALSSTVSSGSGLEILSQGLTLLQGCADGQVLKWNEANDSWECANDTGASFAVVNIQNNDVSVGTNVDTIDFSTDFSLTASPANEANVSIADDILDFTEFADALTLDAATDIALGSLTLSTSGTGALDFNSTGQVSFAGNVNAENGLDVTGADLTIGGSYSISTLGVITAATNETINGIDINAGAVSDVTTLTASSTITGGSLTDGTASLSGGTLDLGVNTIADGNFTGDWAFNAGNLTGIGNLTIDGDISVNGGNITLGTNGQSGQLVLYNELGVTDYSVTFNPSASQTGDITYTLPPDDGSSNYVLTTDGAGVLTWQSTSGIGAGGDITAVGNITSGDAFTSGTPGGELYFADNGFLGLGSSAGRIEFDDQATDEVNILAANVGIGTSTPGATLDVNGNILLSGTNAQITTPASTSLTIDPGYSSKIQLTNGIIISADGTNGLRPEIDNSVPLGISSYRWREIHVGTNDSTFGGDVGIRSIAPDAALEVNSATGNNLRLTYNDSDGSATNYVDFLTTSGGDLTIAPSGNNVILGDNVQLNLGTGTDLDIYHDGTSSRITNGTGNLQISTTADLTQTAADDIILTDAQVTAIQLSDVDTTLPNSNVGIVDAINDAYNAATGSGGVWTVTAGTPDITYLTDTTSDFVIGGSTLAASIFGIDESTGNFYFGYDNSANPTFNFEATDGDTATFGFNTNDTFDFSGGLTQFNYTNTADAQVEILDVNTTFNTTAQSTRYSSGIQSGANIAVGLGGFNNFKAEANNISTSSTITQIAAYKTGNGTSANTGLATCGTTTCTLTNGYGVLLNQPYGASTGRTFNVTNDYGVLVEGPNAFDYGGQVNITNRHGIRINDLGSTGLAVTNNYGIYLENQTGGSSASYSLYTNLGDISIGDNLILRNDNDRLQIGAGQDLQLYHDGTNSYITNATGDFIFDNTNTTGSTLFTLGTDTSATDFIVRNDSGLALLGVNGAGAVQLGSDGQDGQLVLYNELGATDYSVTFNPSASQTANITYTLPPDDGTSNYVLSTDGSGVLTWKSVTGVGGGTGTITAVGDITSGDAFTSGTPGSSLFFADNGYLGLGASAGRIEFDDQTTDEVNILAANVGIGTSTPGATLDILNSTTGQKALNIQDYLGNNRVTFYSDTTNGVTFNGYKVSFSQVSGTGKTVFQGGGVDYGYIYGGNETFTGDNQPHLVFTNSNNVYLQGDSSGTTYIGYNDGGRSIIGDGSGENLLVVDNGVVGISTTAADAALEINSATGDNLRLTYNDADGSAVNYADFLVSSSGDLTLVPSGGDLQIGQDGTGGALTLYNELGATDYSVTFNPSASQTANITYTLPPDDGTSNYVLSTDGSGVLTWKSVTGVGGGTGTITAVGDITSGDAFTSGTPGSSLFFADNGYLGLGASAGRIEFDDQATDEVNILAANVGIGTSTPSTQLDVAGDAIFKGATDSRSVNIITSSTSDVGVYVQDTDGNGWVMDAFTARGSSGTNLGGLGFVGSDDDLTRYYIGTSGSERLSILNAGNVGIGTTLPGRALEVNSATGNNLRLTYNDADGSATNYADLLTTSGGDLTIAPSGGDTSITGNLAISGNVDLGDGLADTVTFNGYVDSGIVPYADSTYALGNSSRAFTSGWLNAVTSNSTNGLALNSFTYGTTAAATALRSTPNVNPTSGTVNFTGFNLAPTLNYTGTATGSYTVLNIAPTLTAAPTGTNYGLKIADITSGTPYSIYTGLGDTSFGDDILLRNDNDRLQIGAGGDLDLYHDGTDSYITNATGDFIFDNTNATGSTFFTLGTDTSATDFIVRNDSGLALLGVNGAGAVQLGSDGQSGQLVLYNELGVTDYSVTFNPSASQTGDITYTLPPDDGSSNYVLTTDGAGVLTWQSTSGIGAGGDITAVGNITSGDAFTSGTPGGELYFADNGFLGLGSSAGRIEFDDQATDEVNILAANVGIGTSTPAHVLDVLGSSARIQSSTGLNTYLTSASDGGNLLLFLKGATTVGKIGYDSSNQIFTLQTDSASAPIFIRTNGNQYISLRTNGDNERIRVLAGGSVGFGTSAPDAQLEINSATGDNLRLTYNDSDGSAVNYADFSLSSSGDLTIAPSGGDLALTGNFDASGTLTAGTADAFQVDASGNVTALSYSDGTASITGGAGTGFTSLAVDSLTLDGTTLSSSGALALTSAASGDISITASDDIIFTDAQVTAIQLSDVDTSLPNSNTGIVDAINDAYNAATGSGGVWTVTAGTPDVTYLTDTTSDFVIGGSTLASSIFSIDESTGTFYFGYDNSANPTFEFEATDGDSATFGFNTNDAFYFNNANVGIGDGSPDYTFEVSDGVATPSFALSDDDVGHGLSTLAQTDIFSLLTSLSTTAGGAEWTALSDTDAQALSIRGVIGSTDPTDTTPAVKIIGAKSNGTTGLADLGALETVFQVANNDNASALTITGNGYVGINDTTPDGRFDIADSGLSGNDAFSLSLSTTYTSGGNRTSASLFTSSGSTNAGITPSSSTTSSNAMTNVRSYFNEQNNSFTDFAGFVTTSAIGHTSNGPQTGTEYASYLSNTPVFQDASSALTNFYGFLQAGDSETRITNKYGIYVGDLTGSTLNYSLYTGLGDASFGDDILLRNDSDRLQIGAGGDLDLYHDGTNSIIANATGNLQINGAASSGVVFNESGADVDFRVEGTGQANALFVQGSDGYVGIGTGTPGTTLDVAGTIRATTTGSVQVDGNSVGTTTAHDFTLRANNTGRLVIEQATGDIGIGTNAPDMRLEINSATGNNLRLTYNDSNGSATNYTDLALGSDGSLTTTSTGATQTWAVASTNELALSATALYATTAEGNSLGSTSNEWEALYVGDNNGVFFGLDQDWSLGYDEATDDRLELTTAGTTGFAASTAAATNTAFSFAGDSITTATAFDISADALTSGNGFRAQSTSTSSSFSGNIGLFDWSPGSATTGSGDVLQVNIGNNGTTTGYILNITDNNSTVFGVSETQIVNALPTVFTSPGDVSFDYDAIFTNQTASKIESYGPLSIVAGESFESNDLTLQTYNNGNIILNNDTNGVLATFDGASGNLQLGSNGLDGSLTLYNELGATDYSVTFQPSSSQAASTTYTLPTNYPAGNDYVLTSQTDGTLAWNTVNGVNGVTESGTQADTQIAYFLNDDQIASSANFTFDDATNIFGVNGTSNFGDGGTTNYASFNTTGDLTFNGSADTITFAGAGTITSTTSSALTLDSGTTGALNLGTGNNAKTINLGTGTAGNTINIGTNNTTADAINIGSALDNVAITGDDWSITNAGVISGASLNLSGAANFTPTTTGTLVDFNLETEWTAGTLLSANWASSTAQSSGIFGLDLDFSNLTTNGTNAVYGIRLQDTADNTNSIIRGITIEGTNWDQAIFSNDDIRVTDGAEVELGTGGDLALVHDGTNSYINSGTGDLIIDNTLATGSTINRLGTDTNATDFQVQNNSTTALFTVDGGGTVTIPGTVDLGTNTIADGNFNGNWAFNSGALSGISTIAASSGTSTTLALTRSSAGEWISFADGTDTWGLYNVAGSPEGVLTANIGALAMDTTNGTLYVKTTADGTNTDWTNLATGGSSPWTDSGTTTYLTTTTDELVLGGSSPLSSAKFSIDGDADQTQLIVQGNATQTTDLAIFEQSDGTDVFNLTNAGNLTLAGDVTVNGGDILGASTFNLLNSGSTTINFAGAATALNIADAAITGTIDIGGVTANGASTINIATEGTSADTLTFGNSNASTTFALTGGDDWNINATGDAGFEDLTLSGTTVTFTTSGAVRSTGTSSLYLDSGTTGTVLLGTGNDAKGILIGTGAAANTINIGTDNTTGDTLNIGNNNASTTLSLIGGDDWSISTAGVLTQSTGTNTAINLTRSSAGQWIGFNDGTDTWGLYNYAGSPEGNITANTGALAMDTSNGTLYVKTDDADATGWTNLATGGSTEWTLSGTTVHPNSATTDMAVGVASDTLVAPFSVDESANTVRIGEGSNSNAVLNMYSSAGDTGSITYTTSDEWNFTGGGVNLDSYLDLDSTSATAFTLGDGTNNYVTFDGSTDAGDTLFNITGASSGITSGTILGLAADTITSGVGLDISVDGLVDGTGLNLTSTSTALTTGSLLSLDWSATGSVSSTADLFTINVGSGEIVNSLLNITNNGSSVFKVGQNLITSAVPHEFTAAGDASFAYDINLTNQTSSTIESNAPLYIVAGEPAESNNLTLKTYNSGDIILDTGATGYITAQNAFSVGAQTTFTAADTTPDVSSGSHFITSGTATITDFDAGSGALDAGHIIYVECNSAVTFDVTSSGLNGGTTDIVCAAGDMTTWIYDGTDWNLISWMDDSTNGGQDLAEYFVSTQTLEVGDLVSIDPIHPEMVVKATNVDGQRIIGAVSTQPGLTLGTSVVEGMKVYPIALAGRVPVKVDPNSAPIENGDLISASSDTGKAQKVTSGYITGRALESWTPNSGKTTVTIFVNPAYIPFQMAFTSFGQLTSQYAIESDNTVEFAIRDITQGQNITESLALAEALIGRLEVGLIHTQRLEANSITTQQLTAQDFQVTGEATVSGKLTTRDLATQNLSVETATVAGQLYLADGRDIASLLNDNDNYLASLSAQTQQLAQSFSEQVPGTSTAFEEFLAQLTGSQDASISAALAAIQSQQDVELDAESMVLAPDAVFVKEFLSVSGFTQLSDVNVASSLSIGNGLLITEDTIASTEETLYIQPTGTGSLNILAGLMTLTPNGAVTINGDLHVIGSATIAQGVKTNELTPSDFSQDLSIKLASPSASVLGETTQSELTIRDASNSAVASIDASGSAKFSTVSARGITIEAPTSEATTSAAQQAEIERKQTAGRLTLNQGEDTLVVANDNVTEDSLIYLTATSDTQNQVLYVAEKQTCQSATLPCQPSFTVQVNQPASVDISFNFWIVNVKK